MRSIEYAPCPRLRPFVRLIWQLEIDDLSESIPPERISPDGLVELVFHYRIPLACRYDGEVFSNQPRSAVVSQTRRFVEIQPIGPAGLISVRFQPWGAYHFFEPPVSDFADSQLCGEDLWGNAVFEIEERLADCSNNTDRVRVVEAFLIDQLSRHQRRDLERPVRAIWQRQGQLSLPNLCHELGVGERSLQRMFSDGLGMSPKAFARLSRFLFACAHLRRRAYTTLSEVGPEHGFYDQSHFNADFKAYSGITPLQFIQGRNFSFLEPD